MSEPEIHPEDDKHLQLTALSSLLVAVAGAMLVAWYIVRTFYGSLATFSVWISVPLILLALLDFLLAWYIRRSIKDNRVGLDRHQLHPLHAARALVVGRASAWAGAIFLGIGLGAGIYVWPKAGVLAAAQADTPGLIVFAVTGLLLSAGGLVLERACRVPPSGIEEEKFNDAAMPS